jgi:Fe-S-cluster containining protein
MSEKVDQEPQGGDQTLQLEENLCFECGQGVACFNECCRDVTIFLGPYDILRLRQALGLTAKEFIAKYTRVVATDKLIPLIALRMNEEDEKRCHFVMPEGCSVYGYRPWACRMFPLDVTEDGKGFRVIIDDSRCLGLREKLERRVLDYLNDQGTPKYQVMDDLMGELVNNERFRDLDVTNSQIQQMAFMALYDLDTFRSFIFNSSFLERFEVDERRIKRLEKDDEELLRFGFEWVAFGLLGRQTLKVSDAERERQEQAEQSAEEGA